MHWLTQEFQVHYRRFFEEFGATTAGVQWGDPAELHYRYSKIAEIIQRDCDPPAERPTLLDVGCGWGGLQSYLRSTTIDIDYTGVDVVNEMVAYARSAFPEATFIDGDVFDINKRFDYVVANGVLTQKLSATIPEMEALANSMIDKMFQLCRHGIAVNLMSTQVNYMVNNLYYRNPVEFLAYCFSRLSPRVILDHGYSSLGRSSGKFFDYIVYVYRSEHDQP